jgi:subtilisin family serine protease
MSNPIGQLTSRDLHRATGKGIDIALIDTGADSLHPELEGRIAGNYEAHMGNPDAFVTKAAQGCDPNAHGTACAGILARLAPGARIHSIQVIGKHPCDTPEKLIAGLRFAVARRWPVINISAGTTNPKPELHKIVHQAVSAGAILIAAKDNRQGKIGFPAAYPEVIAVDMDYFPDPLSWRYYPGAEVEIEASGIYVDAPRAGGGRLSYTGTSFAAPHVAAIAARVKQLAPHLDVDRFREFLSRPALARS